MLAPHASPLGLADASSVDAHSAFSVIEVATNIAGEVGTTRDGAVKSRISRIALAGSVDANSVSRTFVHHLASSESNFATSSVISSGALAASRNTGSLSRTVPGARRDSSQRDVTGITGEAFGTLAPGGRSRCVGGNVRGGGDDATAAAGAVLGAYSENERTIFTGEAKVTDAGRTIADSTTGTVVGALGAREIAGLPAETLVTDATPRVRRFGCQRLAHAVAGAVVKGGGA